MKTVTVFFILAIIVCFPPFKAQSQIDTLMIPLKFHHPLVSARDMDEDMLYDQITPFMNVGFNFGIPSQYIDLNSDYDFPMFQAAESFEIPPDECWNIDEVICFAVGVDAMLWIDVYVYSNKTTIEGMDAPDTLIFLKQMPEISMIEFFEDDFFLVGISLGSVPKLSSGKYWISMVGMPEDLNDLAWFWMGYDYSADAIDDFAYARIYPDTDWELYPMELNFMLLGSKTDQANQIPVSNMALFISIFLIGLFIVLTFRRIST